MTIGDTTLPSKIPNLNQILFKGLRIDEFSKPKIKKNIASIIVEILILPPLNNGYNEIIKKNVKKTNPKLLLEDIFSLSLSISLHNNDFLLSNLMSIPLFNLFFYCI